ncbi:MAG: matrixin family metalloprotease [Snowella sp.]|nr:matrixin family metalloprotease [Snowella sp.]
MATSLFLLLCLTISVGANHPEAIDLENTLPPLQVHPLPASLAKIPISQNTSDYFDHISPTPLGYLVWSEFPIKVYLDRPPEPVDSSASSQRFQQWTELVLQAIAEWNDYLPLKEVSDPIQADIVIQRTEPPLGTTVNPETGQIQIPRARTAQTRYQFDLSQTSPPRITLRMTIQIKPGLSQTATLAAIRHELGHALGIWGHSPDENDIMFYSQTKKTSPISKRDINTLIKLYKQATRLGWPISS